MTGCRYGWIITRDYVCDRSAVPAERDDVGTFGPNDTPFGAKELRASTMKFRLYDADDLLYYEGTFLGDPDDEDCLIAPLENFVRRRVGFSVGHGASIGFATFRTLRVNT